MESSIIKESSAGAAGVVKVGVGVSVGVMVGGMENSVGVGVSVGVPVAGMVGVSWLVGSGV